MARASLDDVRAMLHADALLGLMHMDSQDRDQRLYREKDLQLSTGIASLGRGAIQNGPLARRSRSRPRTRAQFQRSWRRNLSSSSSPASWCWKIKAARIARSRSHQRQIRGSPRCRQKKGTKKGGRRKSSHAQRVLRESWSRCSSRPKARRKYVGAEIWAFGSARRHAEAPLSAGAAPSRCARATCVHRRASPKIRSRSASASASTPGEWSPGAIGSSRNALQITRIGETVNTTARSDRRQGRRNNPQAKTP